jgi:hypothetical protein
LKNWHCNINDVSIDATKSSTLVGLKNHDFEWEKHGKYFANTKMYNVIKDAKNFEFLKDNCAPLIVDVAVCFSLKNKIDNVDEYGKNFKYLRKLLSDFFINLNCEHTMDLDESSLKSSQVVFPDLRNDKFDVFFPKAYFIPLYPPS